MLKKRGLARKKSLMKFAGFLSEKRANEIEESIKKLREESENRMTRIARELGQLPICFPSAEKVPHNAHGGQINAF